MTGTRHYLCLAVGLVAMLALGCGGGGNDLAKALQSVKDSQLAIMVLPQAELGQEAADLHLDAEVSGFADNGKAADSTFDPNDTAADLGNAGRTNGYELVYNDLSRLGEGGGVAQMETSLDLFKDADGASKFIAQQIDDLKRFEGKAVSESATIESVTTFKIDGLADEATGGKYAFNLENEGSGQSTFVVFRLGRLVGAAIMVRADDKNVDSRVEEIARAFEKRIRGVLVGDITGTPVPLQ